MNDTYAKESLVAYTHRIRMCEEAIRPFEWARVDTWEACQPRFVRTHEVATRIVERVGEVLGCEVCVFVVCGDDLVGCMQNREIWPKESVQKLCEVVAFVVKKRVCGDLSHFKGHVVWIDGWVGDLSSTLVRFVMSLLFLGFGRCV